MLKQIITTACALSLSVGNGAAVNYKVSYSTTKPESMIRALNKEFDRASTEISEDAEIVIDLLGEDYESYQEEADEIEAFYENSYDRAEELYENIADIRMDYFMYASEEDDWETLLQDYLEALESGMTDFYETWTDAYADVLDESRILIEEGDLEFSESLETWVTAYNAHTGAWNDVYNGYSEAYDQMLLELVAVAEGFEDGKTDVESLIESAQEKEEEDEEEELIQEDGDSDVIPEEEDEESEMDEEFLESMQAYTDFYDDYIEFLAKYKKNPTSSSMIKKYSSMMEEALEANEAFEAWEEEDLTDEEQEYYDGIKEEVEEKMAAAME